MCGIVGVLERGGRPVQAGVVARMMGMQGHRGPDDEGMRGFSLRRGVSEEIALDRMLRGPSLSMAHGMFEGILGFNRLSILDLSLKGHQPMCSADGKILLVCNGEIYNAFDFVSELEQRGCVMRGKSDSEVLLYLYQEFGVEETLRRVNGMFAICVVDLGKREMHLVRDRMGIKPLYWAEVGETVLFASEMKTFLAWPGFRTELDEGRVEECLAYRYCAGEGTLLKNVRQVRAGCRLRVTTEGVSEQRWWAVPEFGGKRAMSFAEATEEMGRVLERSVGRQMMGDVKVGCQLSGGIDSSLVSLYAGSKTGVEMDAVSVVFADPEVSEEKWMGIAAEKAGMRSHRFELTPEYVLGNLERASWHLDEPMNAPNTVGIYFLAERAKAYMTVLLSGEGADELCGGYERFAMAAARAEVRPWRGLLGMSPSGQTRRGVKRMFEWAGDDVEWYLRMTMFLGEKGLAEVRPTARVEDVLERRRGIFAEGKGDYAANCMKYEMQTYLVSLLMRQDKMTMAHGLENRVPMLDNAVVDFVRGLPSEYLVRGAWKRQRQRMRNTKRVLKAVAEKHFAADFVYRGKNGFHLPLREYFAHPLFEVMMRERLLPGMKKRGVVRAEVVERWWKETAAEGGNEQGVWNCVAFEIWAQGFLDRSMT